jgi:zinc protease
MMQRRKLSAAALAAILALATIAAPPPLGAVALQVAPPELKVARHQLANGLEVLLLEDHSVPVAAVQVWYHVGSKDEKKGRSGFAHLFEHLMFKGSANVGPEEHAGFIQSIGGRYNATTDFDRTLYYQVFPSNYLERVLWMEADRMRSLDVSDENFRSEREVVKEERRLRYENPPYGRLAELVFAALYTTHPYKITTIGTMADLNAATVEDVREFHSIYYVPNNTTLVIAGDFQPAQVLAWVEKNFGNIPRGKEIPRDIPAEPEQKAERRSVDYDSKTPLPAVIMAFHTPAAGEPDTYPLDVAGNLLSSGQSSRLYRKMVYEQQSALQAAGQNVILEDPGAFFFFAIMQPGHTAEEGEKSLMEEVERLKREPVPAAELEKAKNQIVSNLVFGRQAVYQKAQAVGYADVILGNLALANSQLAEYQKVSPADIQRVAKKYLTPENLTVLWMLPESMRPGKGGDKPAAQPQKPGDAGNEGRNR